MAIITKWGGGSVECGKPSKERLEAILRQPIDFGFKGGGWGVTAEFRSQ